MTGKNPKSGGDLFIVDNSDQDWKVVRYLSEWCSLSNTIDIATGSFEIGSLLALDGEWQKVEKIRILMGDEVSLRTKEAFKEGVKEVARRLDGSIEDTKENNDFLKGVPAIVEGLRSGKIICRVYRKAKFHAKAYITHARHEVVGSSALVGSSNFSWPGLNENVELNVQVSGRQVNALQEWYDDYWKQAEDVTQEVLRVIERHVREYSPFEVYAKALYEYLRGYEVTAKEWEENGSRVYNTLSGYQRDGYHDLLEKGRRYSGAFLCDGVGLGKTYIGLMLIERLTRYERKHVVLFVPKAAREPVWEKVLKEYVPEVYGPYGNLTIYNHTDLTRGGKYPEELKKVQEGAHVVIIDEAHHFRNTGVRGEEGAPKSRYWHMFDICEDKTLFLLTATPLNNRMTDLQHMIELFSRRQAGYFQEAPLGIHSLPGHFRKMENALKSIIRDKQDDDIILETNLEEAKQVLNQDELFSALVVQRSRTYVKKSLGTDNADDVLFPDREDPKVVPYSIKETYGGLLALVKKAFDKDEPLFTLPVYYPYRYYCGDDESIDPLKEGRQRQVVSLIRTQFLKRFESSARAFEMSCWNLLFKLLAWVEVHAETNTEKNLIKRWQLQHEDLLGRIREKHRGLFRGVPEPEAEEDIISEEILETVGKLSPEEFRIGEIISETILDLDQIAEFLGEIQKFDRDNDDKLRALIRLLQTDPVLKKQKVLIFTEFVDTARYIYGGLKDAGVEGLGIVHSQVKGDRGKIIERFSPYYNGLSSDEITGAGIEEIRVLVSTDVLSEGLNLQDATRLINYDLHWNPVRLMQRIGRIDRRIDAKIETRILNDHPDQKDIRGRVAYWNFLPPEELDDLLNLYEKVTHKTLRISKTFGIEGGKLLRPEDEYEDLREFNESYEGQTSPEEDMRLELKTLLESFPGLEERLAAFPRRVFSGKEHPTPGTKAVFFCYGLPGKETKEGDSARQGDGSGEWSEEAGFVRWYLYDLATGEVSGNAPTILEYIRSNPETERSCVIDEETLAEIRGKVDKHIKNTYLKKVQAPVGIKPVLKAWMELN